MGKPQVLVRFAGLDVLDRHAIDLQPAGKCFAQKLWPVVGTHNLRQAMIVLDLLEHAHQTMRVDRRINLDVKYLAVGVVDHVEGAEASAARQSVAHEVDRPDGIRQPWDIQRDTLALGKTPLRSAAQVEPHGLVHAIDSLRVPVRTRPAQHVAAFPKAATRPIFDNTCDRRDQPGIAHCPVERRRIPRRTCKPDACTGPTQRPRVYLDQVPHGLALARRP